MVMRIDIITCLPKLLESPLGHSIVKRGVDKGLVEIYVHDLRDYGKGKHRQVDDYAYGGVAGMVLMVEPVVACIESLRGKVDYDEVIYMSPDGEQLSQPMLNQLSQQGNLLILCGHYKGIDERIRRHFITREISVGDYVLSGGELPAAAVVDGIVRLIPGVISDMTSALTDSYQKDLVAPPLYSRPASFRGMEVPQVLRSGNHAEIASWLNRQAIERTKARRPDLLKK